MDNEKMGTSRYPESAFRGCRRHSTAKTGTSRYPESVFRGCQGHSTAKMDTSRYPESSQKITELQLEPPESEKSWGSNCNPVFFWVRIL
jgi:hypothetical protein